MSEVILQTWFCRINFVWYIKVWLSSSRKNCFICFNESHLKMIKGFFFILEDLFVLKIFKSLSWIFVIQKKRLDRKDKVKVLYYLQSEKSWVVALQNLYVLAKNHLHWVSGRTNILCKYITYIFFQFFCVAREVSFLFWRY